MNISQTTGTRTSNYRIRKLTDGRIGQVRKEQVVHFRPTDENTEGPGEERPSVGDGDNDAGENINMVDDPPREPSEKKAKRKSVPDTWAVCSYYFEWTSVRTDWIFF